MGTATRARATVIAAWIVLALFLLGSLGLYVDRLVDCLTGDEACAQRFSRKEAALTMGLWLVVLSGLITVVALARQVPDRSRFIPITGAVTAAAALGLLAALSAFG